MTSAVRLRSIADTPPWGALLLGTGVLGVALVGLLHLDHLPFSFCLFKTMTGLPCPTCGTTRAFGRLFALDAAGAFALNPLATLGAFGLLAWGSVEILLLPSRRALAVDVSDGLGRGLRVAVILAVVLNWLFLIATQR